MRHSNPTITDTMITVSGIRRNGYVVTGVATRAVESLPSARSLLLWLLAWMPAFWHRVKPGSGASVTKS